MEESKGIIGIQLDERRLASDPNGRYAWDNMAIGSDYDGWVDPLRSGRPNNIKILPVISNGMHIIILKINPVG